MSKYNCQVKYWAIKGEERKEVNYICFSGIGQHNNPTLPDKVIYEVPIDASLTREHVEFYISFLSSILDENKYEYEFIKIENEAKTKKLFSNGEQILWTLNCNGLKRHKILLYLTAFRYISEQPEILIEFFKSKDKSDKNEVFKDFQECHIKSSTGKLGMVKYGNLCGHGLIYDYYWVCKDSSVTYITLENFKKNLNDNEINNVQRHFEMRKIPQKV